MGRHHPDSDANPNAYSDTDAYAESRRQPASFAVANRLPGCITGADVCVPAAFAERKSVSRRAIADCHAFTNRESGESISHIKTLSIAIPERDTFADKKGLASTREKLRRVDTEFPD